MSDKYQQFVSSGFGRTLAARLGLPSPVQLRRFTPGEPVLTDPDSIRRAILDANADDRVVGLITWMHTFSPAKMWISGLKVLAKLRQGG